MAFSTVYSFSFLNVPFPAINVISWRYRVRLLRDNYAGEVVTLLPGGTPLRVNYDGSDNIFESIRPLKFTLSLACQDYWQAKTLVVESDRELQLLIDVDQGGTGDNYQPMFAGWVLPTELKEDYEAKPYYVTLSAACGLATLKERPIVDSNGKRLSGLVSLSTILRTALSQTGHNLPLRVATNLYEQSDLAVGQLIGGNADPTRDPLHQTLVRADALLNDKYETINSYDAVRQESLPFTLTTGQTPDGNWLTARVPELAGGWDTQGAPVTVQARTYNPGNVSSAPDSQNSFNLNIYTGPILKIARSGTKWQSTIKPGVRLEQSFGRMLSKLPNGDFAQIDGTGLPINWLVNNISQANRFRVGTGTQADPYRLRLNGAGDERINSDTPCVLSTVIYPTVSKEFTTFQKRTLKGRAQLFNARAAKVFVRVLRDDPYPYIYTQTGLLYEGKIKEKEKVATLYYHTRKNTQNRDETKPGWFDWSLDLGEIDRVRQITVYLCVAEALDKYDGSGNVIGAELGPPTPYVEYADVRLETTQVGLVLDGRQETRVKTGQQVKDTTLSLTLGDIPDAAQPYDRTGAFFSTQSGNTFTSSGRWFRPDADILAANQTGKDVPKTLLAWNTEAYARQLMYPANTFEGTLIGRLPYGMFSVLHITDILDSSGDTVPHILTRWEWDVRMCQHTVTAVEMEPGRVATLPTAKKQWQTPDGLLDINPGENGAPLEPAEPGKLSDLQKLKSNLKLVGIDAPVNRPRGPLVAGLAPLTGFGPVFSATASVNGQNRLTVEAFAARLEKLKFTG